MLLKRRLETGRLSASPTHRSALASASSVSCVLNKSTMNSMNGSCSFRRPLRRNTALSAKDPARDNWLLFTCLEMSSRMYCAARDSSFFGRSAKTEEANAVRSRFTESSTESSSSSVAFAVAFATSSDSSKVPPDARRGSNSVPGGPGAPSGGAARRRGTRAVAFRRFFFSGGKEGWRGYRQIVRVRRTRATGVSCTRGDRNCLRERRNVSIARGAVTRAPSSL